MNIITAGRTDIKSYFELSGVLQATNLNHTPFIVFRTDGVNVSIAIAHSVNELLTYPETTQVMGQWIGKYRSDFFQFTVKDVKDFMKNEQP